jgi:pyruvate,water dikinase
MSEPLIAWLDDQEHASARALGGKFASLADLAHAGFAVPAGFTVTTAAWQRFLAASGLEDEARAARAIACDDLPAIDAASAAMARAIEGAPLPADVESAVRDADGRLEELAGNSVTPVAVRSSGVAEDLAAASFAGQYDTFLWIAGADAVLLHLRRCWSGLFSAPVLSYRPTGHQPPVLPEPAMAVGVQRMIASRAAGVMFTLDPLNGDRSKVTIEGAWGLGELVVGGEVTPDRYRVDKRSFAVVDRAVATKELECRFDPATGATRVGPVPPERSDAACLDDAEVVALAQLGRRIERHRRGPVDIEWAIDEDGAIHVLQVRAETVWSRRRPAAVGGVERVLARFMEGA